MIMIYAQFYGCCIFAFLTKYRDFCFFLTLLFLEFAVCKNKIKRNLIELSGIIEAER